MALPKLALLLLVLLTLVAAAGLWFLLAAARERRLAGGALLAVALSLALLPPVSALRARGLGVEGCAAELGRLGAALELYGRSYGLYYPDRLEQLVPTYFESLPYCPAARAGSAGAEESNPYLQGYSRSEKGGLFTVRCSGHHHAGLGGAPADHPYYSAEWGLVRSP